MAAWTDYTCICTAACGTWLAGNNPDNIDFSGKTEGIDYIILKYRNSDEIESPDVNVKPIVNRNTMATGIGKVSLSINVNGYVNRRESGPNIGSAIDKYNKIKEFVRKHDKLSDTAVYYVNRVDNPTSGYDYDEYEDNAGNYDRKYLKGKCGGINKKHQTYGFIEYKLQFLEAWLP